MYLYYAGINKQVRGDVSSRNRQNPRAVL